MQLDPVTVYQYFDAAGRLLYVGITNRGTRRQHEHADTKEWWPLAVACTLEHFRSRSEALAREAELIQRHFPPFNTVHNPIAKTPSGVARRTLALVGKRKDDSSLVDAWRSLPKDQKRKHCRDCWVVPPTRDPIGGRFDLCDSCRAKRAAA